MPKEEITTGLKNAIERGQSIEKAVSSMILAGYDSQDVNEAASSINFSAIPRMPAKSIPENQAASKFIQRQTPTQTFLENMPNQVQRQIQQLPQAQFQKIPSNNLIQETQEKPKRKFPKIIIVLLVILFILITILISFSVIGPKILDLFLGK